MRISDWSSDVLLFRSGPGIGVVAADGQRVAGDGVAAVAAVELVVAGLGLAAVGHVQRVGLGVAVLCDRPGRSEAHTSEPQSLMRISYAVFCLIKINKHLSIYS